MDRLDAPHDLSWTDQTWLQGKQFTKPDCLKTKHPVEEIQSKVGIVDMFEKSASNSRFRVLSKNYVLATG